MKILQQARFVAYPGDVIFSPLKGNVEGYYLESGTVLLIKKELELVDPENYAFNLVSGPTIINIVSIIKTIPTRYWAVARTDTVVYKFDPEIFLSEFKTDDVFLSAIVDYTLQRITSSIPDLTGG